MTRPSQSECAVNALSRPDDYTKAQDFPMTNNVKDAIELGRLSALLEVRP